MHIERVVRDILMLADDPHYLDPDYVRLIAGVVLCEYGMSLAAFGVTCDADRIAHSFTLSAELRLAREAEGLTRLSEAAYRERQEAFHSAVAKTLGTGDPHEN